MEEEEDSGGRHGSPPGRGGVTACTTGTRVAPGALRSGAPPAAGAARPWLWVSGGRHGSSGGAAPQWPCSSPVELLPHPWPASRVELGSRGNIGAPSDAVGQRWLAIFAFQAVLSALHLVVSLRGGRLPLLAYAAAGLLALALLLTARGTGIGGAAARTAHSWPQGAAACAARPWLREAAARARHPSPSQEQQPAPSP